MDAASRVARNTGFLYVRIAINIVIALFSTRLILDALGIENFGIYNLVGGAIAIFGFSLIGVLYSGYLTYLELAVIHAICQYCVISAVVMVLIFIISIIKLNSAE